MANIQTTPALDKLVQDSTDKLTSIANFIVDNNPAGIFAVLRANGYEVNTNGEAAIIVRAILIGTSDKQKSELNQLSKVPYLNDNANGTGGLKGPIGGMSTQGAGDDLVCIVSSLFSFPIACPPVGLTPEQVEQQRKDAEAAAKKSRQTTYIIIGIAVVVLILGIIYFTNKSKKEKTQ